MAWDGSWALAHQPMTDKSFWAGRNLELGRKLDQFNADCCNLELLLEPVHNIVWDTHVQYFSSNIIIMEWQWAGYDNIILSFSGLYYIHSLLSRIIRPSIYCLFHSAIGHNGPSSDCVLFIHNMCVSCTPSLLPTPTPWSLGEQWHFHSPCYVLQPSNVDDARSTISHRSLWSLIIL